MARGIIESDVHTAADELVAKGERPTVERIRAHLGTGSPNTVTRWLETWWNRLGTRLQPRRPDFNDAPAVLAELAGQWWELALKHAKEAALREFAESEQSLATQRDALDARSQVVADELSQMRSERAAAMAGERVATTQAAELERLVDQLRLQISELTDQRDLGLRRADRAEAARQQLDARLHEALETAKSEREDWTELARRRKIFRLNSTIRPKPKGQLRSSYVRSCMLPNLQPSRPVKLLMFSGVDARHLRSNSVVCESFRRSWRQLLNGTHRRMRPRGCAHGGRARSRSERKRPGVREEVHQSSAAFRHILAASIVARTRATT